MKTLLKTPYLPLWVLAALFALLAFAPTYAYVRLIPAGLAVIFAIYGGIGLLKRKSARAARILWWIFTAILIVGFLVLGATGILILHAGATQPETACDYIVVLGAKVEHGGPGDTLQERIDQAYEYLSENPNTVAIVSGGKGGDEPMSEAQCMFDALTAMGIEENRVWMEENATSTWENLKFSLALIEERTGARPQSIGVVSSEFHLFRVQMYAQDRRVSIVGIPAKTETPVRWLHYFIREIAGVWHYLILGGLYD